MSGAKLLDSVKSSNQPTNSVQVHTESENYPNCNMCFLFTNKTNMASVVNRFLADLVSVCICGQKLIVI